MRREDVADRHRVAGRSAWPLTIARAPWAAPVMRASETLPYAARSAPAARSDAPPKRAPPNSCRPDRGVELANPAAPRPVQAPRGGCATPAPTHTYTPPCAFPAPRACDPGDRDRRSHPPEPSSGARAPVCSVSSTNVPQQPGAIAIPRRRPSVDPGQHVRGQVATHHAGAHQQPAQTRCRCARRPASSHPTQASRDRSRRDSPQTRAAMRRTHQIPQLRAGGPAPRGCSYAISVFQTCRCSSVHQLQGQTHNLADRARHVHRRRQRVREHPRPAPRPRAPRPAGSETWPAACRSDNARQQLARCHRSRPSRKSASPGRRPERGCRRPPRSTRPDVAQAGEGRS